MRLRTRALWLTRYNQTDSHDIVASDDDDDDDRDDDGSFFVVVVHR